jgi:calcineurin-like phosphoesterase family protein
MRKRFNSETEKVWFTADLHFGHDAIISHSKRPFECEIDMDLAMEANWNRVVSKRDHVFIIGDFSFRSRKETMMLAKRLNGVKYLIEGNHDRMIACNPSQIFEGGVEKYHEIYVDQQKIVMCHFAFRSWNAMHHGSWNLHGHSHGNLKSHNKQLDVGVDAVNMHYSHLRDLDEGPNKLLYAPMSYVEVKKIMDGRPIRSEDHHQPKEQSQS